MESKLTVLFGFFAVNAFVQIARCHNTEGNLGNITFSCASDEHFSDGYCLKVVDVPMVFEDARRTCQRKGQQLVYAADADEFKNIDHFAKLTWEYYWIGYKYNNDSEKLEPVYSPGNLVDVADHIWDNDQPNQDDGVCVYRKKNGYSSLGDCLRQLPFICKSEAVLKGFFRCRDGLGIQTKFVCDGIYDCRDNSDEINCPNSGDICSEFIDAKTTTSGTITSAGGVYDNKKNCNWFIVTNIGSTVRVKVNTFHTEKNADLMEFYTGGLTGNIILAELTGNVQRLPRIFFSSDNVFIIRLKTDETVLKDGFSIEWTTDIPELFSDVQRLTAISTIQSLKSPLYDTNYLVHERVFEWIITSNTVITLQFEHMDIDDKGKLYLWEDDGKSPNLDVTNVLPKGYTYISRSSMIRLMLMTGADSWTFSKGVHIKYWEGCDINVQSHEGSIFSPGSKANSYPDNIKCTYTIQRETTDTRPLSLRFTQFKLQQDADFLKVYNDTDDNSGVHSGNGFTGTDLPLPISSTKGYIKAEFTSDYVLTEEGFSAEFSINCPELVVSPQTHVTYSEGTVFNSEVTVSCDTGYSFIQEEYNSNSTVKMTCNKGGKWDKDRTPNCMITYCPIPPAVANGYISESSGVMFGGNVTYSCHSGFRRIGFPTIKCKADGQWESAMTCNADQCPPLTKPNNGDLMILEGGPEGRDFASVVQVVCDPGYETLGNLTTVCQTGGTWSHIPASCNKLFCPSPMYEHGSQFDTYGTVFEESIRLTCDSGFGINGTTETSIDLTCQSERLFEPPVSCMDIDECSLATSNCDLTKENCINTIGSHMCRCKSGYIGADCTDIDECNGGKGPCDHSCVNNEPGYTCQCDTGYLLYTKDQRSNISLAEGEDGMKNEDVYQFDHTCVRIQCPVPPPLSNGMVLSKKDLFYYEDTVEFECNPGYKMSGKAFTMCLSSGSWRDDFPTCSHAECTTPEVSSIARSTNIYPGESMSVVYGTMVNIECQYGSQRINRTLYCAYKGNDEYGLLGDSQECPEINCGSPEEIPGRSYTGLSTTTLDSNFTFGCEEGFIKSGMSLEGTDVVMCQENGRWSIGNLTCTGGRCADPGTPGGAEQEAESYEVGKLVFYKCNRNGYLPVPPEPLECIVDTDINSTIRWNTTDLPECLDKTPPIFNNCPTSPIYIDKTEQYMYNTPEASDNSGAVKRIINAGGYYSGLRTNTDIDIMYTAMDFSGNSMNCRVEVRVKDYNVPVLTCPRVLMESISMASGKDIDISQYINTTEGGFMMTYSPSQIIRIDHTTIGNLQRINVTAEDKWGACDSCSFFLETKASACFRESFPQTVANSDVLCTSVNISCTVTCRSGYIFHNGNQTKTYDCENNLWTPLLPPDSCIKYDNPSYLVKFQLVYRTSTQIASNCLEGHNNILTSKNATFTSELDVVCNNNLIAAGPIIIISMESTAQSFDIETEFTIKFLDTTVPELDRDTCQLLLRNQYKRTDFFDYSESASCNSGSTLVTRHDNAENKQLTSGNQCESAALKTTVIGDKCVPCPPGTFSSGTDTCTECPEGKFQGSYGETECHDCPGTGTLVPSSDRTKCIEVCPVGFYSDTGLPPCYPCPEDQYWVNKTTCQICPGNGGTLGRNGVASQENCKLPCPKGEYSVTGYAPCKRCPVNFYQNRTQQDMCEPCTGKQITPTDGSQNESDCMDLDMVPLDSGTVCCDACPNGNVNGCCQTNCSQEISGLLCTNTTCNGHGNCVYKNNRKFCECDTGYVGDFCNMELDPCDSSPCWNGGTCIKTGYNSFNCSCPVDTSCRMEKQDKMRGKDADWQASGVQPFQTTEDSCQSYCLNDNPDCIAIHYTNGFCFVFYNTNSGLESNDETTFWSKECVNNPLFGCDLCEDDLVNSCKDDTCTEYGMCQDMIAGSPICLCPTNGVYTQPRCERETNPCDPDPCKNEGTCVSYDVRYQCICKAGFTGYNCEHNIDDCSNNPDGCLYNGTCSDGINMYTCTCSDGFSGDRCKDRPDYCKEDPCPTGICYNNYDLFNFECKCENPYRNDQTGGCEQIPPCEIQTCVNGTCDSDGKCDCQSGFEGSLCQHNIDDCKDMPCQNNGTCKDKLNGYDCDCVTGYDGADCSNNIDDCVGMCTDPNVVRCDDMINDYKCICKPGFMGRNCTEDIDECSSSPCQHSGTCQNMVNDFNCSCYDGWTGKMCETPVEFCQPSPCQNNGICYNLTDGYFCKCQSGTTGLTCNNSPEVCNVIDPCTSSGTCSNVVGTANCTCTDNYDGSSCHLIKNHCEESDVCKNGGVCITKDVGFECECKSSYAGDTCEIYNDPCDTNPCHSTAKCTSEEDRYICYCQHGELLTDEGCKVPTDPRAANFDIVMDDTDVYSAGLRSSFVMPADSNITVMYWFRLLHNPYNSSILELYYSPIGSERTIATSFDVPQHDLDEEWHFSVVSLSRTGSKGKMRMQEFIDSIETEDWTLSLDIDTSKPMTLYLGKMIGTIGRVSKLNIYKGHYSNDDIYRARESYDHLPLEDLVQGWYNLNTSGIQGAARIFPSEIGNENICDKGFIKGCSVEERKHPTVTCPENMVKTATGRLTSFTGLKTEGDYSSDVTNTRKYSSVHEDEVYIYGSRNEALVGFNDAGNYGICRFKVYVKYNDDCPSPETDATPQYCTGNSGNICELQCPTNAILSMKHSFRYDCGKLGIYNQVNPWKNFVLPTCGDKATQTLDLTVSMNFELSINCIQTAVDEIKTKVENKITVDIANDWPDLCRSCTPTVTTGCPEGQIGKLVDVVFVLHNLGSDATKNGVTYKIKEAILIVILTENAFNDFDNIAGAVLDKDSITVTQSPSCPSDFVVIGDECVKCGKGTYRNDTTMSCLYCEVGTYKTTVGPASCTSCGSGKTTVTFGSSSSSDCIDDCPIGQKYDGSECVDCERHYYQDQRGLDYCLPCPLGTKTSGKGSNSSASCYVDCPAGTELQPDGSCKDCERGYYRSQTVDNCLSCQDKSPGMTTESIKSTTSDDCNIKICYAGNFRNATTNECEKCALGTYQSQDLQDSCENCKTSYTTDGEGKTNISDCIFYCDEGEEVVSTESCRPCPRGTYRSLNVDEILQPCQNCSHGNTTENTGSVYKEECTIRRCEAGQILDKTGDCEDCPVDTYQPDDHPDSNTMCKPCPSDKGTRQSKSDSPDKCILVCSAGQQNDGDSCSPCPKGTWNNGDMYQRFGLCSNCTDNDYTTVGQGSTHPDNCTLRDCDPGYYISGSDCLPCGFAQYQPMRHQEMCLTCSTNQNTSSEASTSQSDCQIYCPKGQEGNVTCDKCQENYYKPVEGISPCTPCTGNYTSNADRLACTELFCDLGFYNDNDNCTACPVGQYKDVRGNSQSCTPCDPGFTTANIASQAESECDVLFCVAGKFENTTSNQCEPCEIKTYKISSGNHACTDCPQNKTTQGTGSTLASDCSVEFCDPGERRSTSNKCELCGVGNYQPNAGKETCIQCKNGYTTDGLGKTSNSDCFEICQPGFQFNSSNKVCVGCGLGYFKNVVGNDMDCSPCPINKTTRNVSSTSQSDCNLEDCLPGYKRVVSGQGCMKCPIGEYQPQKSQTSCISCGSTKTTKSTGSSKLSQCIAVCLPGFEADYRGGCKPCTQGFFSNATQKECTACRNGYTTLGSESTLCIINTITTLSPPVRRIVILEITFRGAFACDNPNVKELVRGIFVVRLTFLTKVYGTLCSPDINNCINIQTIKISVSDCNAAKRKRATDNVITYDVELSDVPESVTNMVTSASRPTSTVLQEDLTVNKESYNPEPQLLTIEDAKLKSINPLCPVGSIVNNQVPGDCEKCPIGTYYRDDSTTAACLPCPVNTYQEVTGQQSCTGCTGVKKYTLSTGSNSSSHCVSECVTQVNYCNDGTCRDDFSLTCVCTDDYEGVRCETRKEKTSSTPAIIGGSIGGGVALLIFITVIIIVCSRFYGSNKSEEDSDSRKFGRYNDTESDAPYRNPIYDNRAYRGPLSIGYGGGWQNEFAGGHNPYEPYIAQKHLRSFDSDNEEAYTGQSPRRIQHEWYQA